MKFKLKERSEPDFKPFKDLKNIRPCASVYRSIGHKANREADGRFTLELTFHTAYLDAKNVILTDYSHTGVFYVENDTSNMQDNLIDLGQKLTIGDRETSLFLIRFEPNILASAGNNKDIPELCDKILASLSNLGFFD